MCFLYTPSGESCFFLKKSNSGARLSTSIFFEYYICTIQISYVARKLDCQKLLAVSAESDALAVTSAALIAAINANDKVCNIGLLSGFFCVLQQKRNV